MKQAQSALDSFLATILEFAELAGVIVGIAAVVWLVGVLT